MRWLLLLLVAGNAAARNRCNQKKLVGIDDLPVQQVIARLLDACPEPPSYLSEWLRSTAEPRDAALAERILFDARDARKRGFQTTFRFAQNRSLSYRFRDRPR